MLQMICVWIYLFNWCCCCYCLLSFKNIINLTWNRNSFAPFYYHHAQQSTSQQNQNQFLNTTPNLLMPAQQSTSNSLNSLSNNPTALYEVSNSTYLNSAMNVHRTSPFENLMAASSSFLPFSSAANTAPMNSIISQTQATNGGYFMPAQHLSFHSQLQDRL